MNIGIVNDLPLAVEALRRTIALRPEHRVLWVATDGAQAVDFCVAQPPDLVLMDLVMPRIDGVSATRSIMERSPCAILIVTANVGANASYVYEAMGAGALDAIGASAGGPTALTALLRRLPEDFPAAIVIVQHVDQAFAIGMAQWLDGYSRLPVRIARQGGVPQAGEVLLAATNDHLHLTARGSLAYTRRPEETPYRPSVDVFFHSVVDHWKGEAIGVLLTGMGRDGALGLKAMRTKGHYTIAQDEATSAVYGMPKAAAAIGAASAVLPLERIADQLISLVQRNRQRRR